MSKSRKWIIGLGILTIILVIWCSKVLYGFYKIEHIPYYPYHEVPEGTFMYTKKSQLESILEQNKERLNRVINQMNSYSTLYRYSLYEIEKTLQNKQAPEYEFVKNNLEDLLYIRDSLYMDTITRTPNHDGSLWQTDNPNYDDKRIVSIWLRCSLNEDTNEQMWQVITGEDLNKYEIVRLYNFVYNR
jgi:hypothetical protein